MIVQTYDMTDPEDVARWLALPREDRDLQRGHGAEWPTVYPEETATTNRPVMSRMLYDALAARLRANGEEVAAQDVERCRDRGVCCARCWNFAEFDLDS